MAKLIELDAPNLSDIEKEYLCKCLDSNFVSTFGLFVQEFEKKFTKYIGAKSAVSTQSGTAAIHIALYELGIRQDDEVIVPSLTFVATINPILYVGAKPVIVDIDPDTWNIDPCEIRRAITKNTKAIIPVHLYGNPCDMDTITKLAKEYGLFIIEDATESLGAKYRKKQTGTFGDLGCFSFNGNKIITTGGGGMVVGKNEDRLDHIKFLVNQARDDSEGYYHPEVGFNYRMTNLESALGLAQMKKIDKFLSKKRKFNKIYREELKGIKFIRFQKEYEHAKSSYWLSCVIFDKEIDIPSLQKKLKENRIPTRRVFIPVVEFPPYKKYKNTDHKNSYNIYENSLCLPSSTLNSEDDIFYVCHTLKTII